MVSMKNDENVSATNFNLEIFDSQLLHASVVLLAPDAAHLKHVRAQGFILCNRPPGMVAIVGRMLTEGSTKWCQINHSVLERGTAWQRPRNATARKIT
jgi:hypothetical protein